MRTFVVFSVLIWSAARAAAGAGDAKAYERECKDCHLMNGAPDKSVEKAMAKKGVKMRSLASKEIQAQSDADWKKEIVEGTGQMKPVKTLSPTEVDGVIAYMRSLKK